MKTKYLFILLSFIITFKMEAQQTSDEKITALYLYRFPKYIQWLDEELDLTKTFTLKIGLLGAPQNVNSQLSELTKKGYPDGTKVEIIRFENIDQITKTHILFVAKEFNPKIETIWAKITGKNTLLVTQQLKTKKLIMINFKEKDENGRIGFQVNRYNIEKEKLIASSVLHDEKGDEIIMMELYDEIQQKLEEEKLIVEQQEIELKIQDQAIRLQTEKILYQQTEIDSQKDSLLKQQKMFQTQRQSLLEKTNMQRIELNKTLAEIDKQQQLLTEKLTTLETKENHIKLQKEVINVQQKAVERQKDSLLAQSNKISRQIEVIKRQNSLLATHEKTIKQQQIILILFIIITIFTLLFIIIIYRWYRSKKKASEQMLITNRLILKQKEELARINFELKKLSIVAAETNNAIIITDPQGYFEWVNPAFTHIFGFTLNQLIELKGNNIIGKQTKPEVVAKIQQCINEKTSVEYEFSTNNSNGETIWVQATLSPILDEHNQIKKLIAVDADITKLKNAEKQIHEQKLEIEKKNIDLEKLSLAVNQSFNAITILDLDGNFEWFNRRFAEIYGCSFKNFLNKKGKNIKEVSTNSNIEAIMKQCIETKQAVSYDSHIDKEKHRINLHTTLTPVLDKDENVTKLIAIDADISVFTISN